VIALVVLLLSALPAKAGGVIITWGENSPEWNQKLHRAGMRMGCSNSPSSCANYVKQALAMQKINRLSVAFGRDEAPPEEMQDYAAQFSAISKKIPGLTEISMDDFLSHYRREFQHASPDAVEKIIAATKSANPRLKFGIEKLSARARGGVDTVYLYLHYRDDAPHYADYVEQTKALFPNAQIVGGSYALDREDYIPCSPTSKRRCTDAEELSNYQRSIETMAQLLKTGAIQGIEFWPGNFGREDEWEGWQNPRWCAPERRAACIANTKKMRQAAAAALASVN
jgi:hypothetical protein